jgi:opacity protein-like surface antigen
MSFTIKSLTAAIITCGLVSTACAVDTGFYMGAQVGATKQNNKTRTIVNNGEPALLTVKPSNTGIGERLFMGININKNAGVEWGFTHYGAATYKVPQTVACSNPSVNLNALDLEGKGMMNVSSSFSLFGKAGMSFARQTVSGSLAQSNQAITPCGGSGSSASSTTSIKPLIGLGMSYDLNPNWVADVSWTRILGGGGIQAADFMGLGISYHFTDKYCGQFLC